jgi:D-tyrosyl-tRNA(Tyr) deacylase
MRAVVQRVLEAGVKIDGSPVAKIGQGLLILVGIEDGDGQEDIRYIVEKCAHLRIFDDAQGKMNCSAVDIGGELLVVSQFTLLGDARRGRRPSYSEAARPEQALPVYQEVVTAFEDTGLPVQSGKFAADMQVHLVNDGPVTLMLDSKRMF